MSASRTIAKNASVLMGSQLVTWALTLVLMIFTTRVLGAVNTGAIDIAFSLWAIISVLVTFGMDVYLLKEVSRDKTGVSQLLGTSILIRSFFFAVGTVGLMLYVWLADYPPVVIYVTMVIGIDQFLSQITGSYHAVLQGMEIMENISLATIASKVVHTMLGITLLLLGYDVYVYCFTSVAGALTMLIVTIILVGRRIKPEFRLNLSTARAMVKHSSPYLLSALVLTVYLQIDVIIISLFADPTAVGWYSAARRLMATSFFIPTILITAIFPALTRMYTTAPDSLPKLMRKSFDLMVLVSIPIGLGLLIVCNQLVYLLFGAEYIASGPVLGVMGLVLIFMYQNILVGKFLTSTDRQNRWTVVMLVATVVTIALDFALIPWTRDTFNNGAIGGAISFLITEFGMMIVGILFMPKGSLGRSNLRTAVLATTAGLSMVAATWWLRDVFIAVPVLVGAVVYLGMIAVLRVVSKEDIALLSSIAQQAMQKMRRKSSEPAAA